MSSDTGAINGRSTPPWSNYLLPKQLHSLTTQAAQQCRNRTGQVPENEAFRNDTQNGKRPPTPVPKYREPIEPQTEIIYEGWLQQNVATVCRKRDDVERVLQCEEAELLAAFDGDRERDPDAAAPRGFALTLLVRESKKCVFRGEHLDCMSFWAYCGGDERAAKDVRFTVLADEDARKYGTKHGEAPRCSTELALVYVNTAGQLSMAKKELEYKDTGRKIFKMLRATAGQLFESTKKMPPPSLFRSMEVGSATVEGGYRNSVQAANDAFWDKLSRHGESPCLQGQHLCFQHQCTFLKIADTDVLHTPQGFAHERVCFGMLFYNKGMHQATYDFLVQAMGEERAKQPNAAPTCAFGLRYADQTADELSLGLHVLRVSQERVSLKGQISCFGLRTSPGARVCMYPNASMQGLVFDLAPFDRVTYNNWFVLPCTQDQVNTTRNDQVLAQWEAAELGVRKYMHCFRDEGDGDVTEDPCPFKILKCEVPPEAPEDQVLGRLVGTPLFFGAVRIGDVYAQLGDGGKELMPTLSTFLVSAIGRLGPDARMSTALGTWAGLIREYDTEAKKLRAEIQTLRRGAAPVVNKPEGDTGPYKVSIINRLIAGMGRKRSGAYKLGTVNNATRIKSIVCAVAVSQSKEADAAEADWGTKHCDNMSNVEAIAAVGRRMTEEPLVLIVLSEGNVGRFLRVVFDCDVGKVVTRPIGGLDALAISGNKLTTVVLYREENTQLVTCVPLDA